MKKGKARLTVTVDRSLVRAGNDAVLAGRARSLSGWVNLALEERATKERRLQAAGEAIAVYEAEFGVITPDELAAQERADQKVAAVVRGGRSGGKRRRRGAA